MRPAIRSLILCGLACQLPVAAAVADGGVTFTDIAENDGAGISYRRAPSPRAQINADVLANGPYTLAAFFATVRPNTPQKGRGAPGVAIFDYDGDGDLDIYVPNGPDAAAALYANQLHDDGTLTFIDRAADAGVEAFDQDGSGVCYGDIDNDGDPDLYVLGTGEPNRLFENLGNGTFADITVTAGVGGGNRHAIACTIADFDQDGLLDIVVGNSYDDWNHRIPVFVVGIYPGNEHNQLFQNQGGNVFADTSAASGLEDVSNMDQPGTTGAAFTWAIGSADYDLDGDVDIFSMDNQGAGATVPEENRGWIRIFDNDGAGNFTDRTIDAGTNVNGGWMGVDFGDFNCDGYMDFFGTDLGYLGVAASRPWIANGDRTFTDTGQSFLGMTPFGWGIAVFDYDNDSDSDIIFHGGVDILSVIMSDNPGSLLTNTGICSGIWDYDATAITRDHNHRTVQGIAVGDLNDDGFADIVSVSSNDYEPFFELPVTPRGGPFDPVAKLEVVFSGAVQPGFATYAGPTDAMGNPDTGADGTLAVEISSGDNGNGWAAFDLVGSAGVLCDDDDDSDSDSDSDSHSHGHGHGHGNDCGDAFAGPTVNRDGIGAVVFFTPDDGVTSMRPVVGGASYASQSSLTASFGLGAEPKGTVEVLWPGGVRNRVYGVHAGERLVLPYIPCSIDGDFSSFGKYTRCVGEALRGYRREGVIGFFELLRLKINAILAFLDEQS